MAVLIEMARPDGSESPAYPTTAISTRIVRMHSRVAELVRVGLLAALAALAGSLALAPAPAQAHSDFSGSEPPDGAEVDGPLDLATLTFALEVADPGSGVVAMTPDGSTIIADLSTSDDLTWEARFSPALINGDYAIRYAMRALDGHMVEGSINLTVSATPSATTAPATPTPVTSAPATSVAPAVTVAPDAASSTTQLVQPSDAAQDEPLSLGPPSWVDPVDHAARAVGDLATLLLVGAMVFALWIWRLPVLLPSPRSTLALALTVATAGAVEIITVAQRLGVNVSESLSDPLMRSPLMTAVAGALIAVGAAAVLGDQIRAAPLVFRILMAVPFAALIAAPAFDGHAVTLGPRLLHFASDIVHVTTTSIWIGTVIGLITVAVNDRRALPDVAARAARWLVGTVAAVTISGLAMTLMILDTPSDLIDTPWGRRLLLKITAVLAAGLIGAHHHWRVVPNLRSDGSTRQFRQSLVVEALLLVTVVVVTSWLVVAMP